MSTRSDIVEQFTTVGHEHGKSMPPLRDDTALLECGLDSLCFAIIVTRLEDQFGVDPFSTDNTLFPVTFGEFIRLYESVVQ